MNLNWDISKQVNWKKRSGSIDSNYFARLVLCRGTWIGNQLGMGMRIGNRSVSRRRWSVPCIQLETANTCWKCPCHAAAVAVAAASPNVFQKRLTLGQQSRSVANCHKTWISNGRAGRLWLRIVLEWLRLADIDHFFFIYFFRSVIKCILL